ncbi:MAG: acyl-CoA dehydratase activase-related protein [Oscillospiraceae bacterium]|nr:acyl-CoA dehydratase activase-related protein [Oscillospiraceae bacterium]
MEIGIPRALLYYRYEYLWRTFFNSLGCKVILSDESNKKILQDGIKFSIDECCLSSKIYMGHVYSLIGKCDYILVPRVESFGKKELVCVKFNAMYDIVKNTFKDIKLLDYNLDARNGESELKGFIQMGRTLGKGYIQSFKAYNLAKKVQVYEQKLRIKAQEGLIKKDVVKILIVSHPYNIHDKMIGYPVIEQIKKLGAYPIYAYIADTKLSIKKSKEISHSLYWTFNKELLGAISIYRDKIDGIILLTAFPCGTDCLSNELVMRKVKNLPVINLVLDELIGEIGIETRIESFLDIIIERKNGDVFSYG